MVDQSQQDQSQLKLGTKRRHPHTALDLLISSLFWPAVGPVGDALLARKFISVRYVASVPVLQPYHFTSRFGDNRIYRWSYRWLVLVSHENRLLMLTGRMAPGNFTSRQLLRHPS